MEVSDGRLEASCAAQGTVSSVFESTIDLVSTRVTSVGINRAQNYARLAELALLLFLTTVCLGIVDCECPKQEDERHESWISGSAPIFTLHKRSLKWAVGMDRR